MTHPIDGRHGFRLPPDVVVEAFADETIAVNLASGRYYSLDPVGGEVLTLLTSGRSWDDAVTHLARRYDGEGDSIETTITGFTQQLVDEGLLEVGFAPDPQPGLDGGPDPGEPVAGAGFAPSITVFSDMQDLLLLDPIHDVDATGWPARPESNGTPPSRDLA